MTFTIYLAYICTYITKNKCSRYCCNICIAVSDTAMCSEITHTRAALWCWSTKHSDTRQKYIQTFRRMYGCLQYIPDVDYHRWGLIMFPAINCPMFHHLIDKWSTAGRVQQQINDRSALMVHGRIQRES